MKLTWIILMGIFLIHCNTGMVVSPKEGSLRISSNAVDRSCLTLSTDRIWTAFYGTLPIGNPSKTIQLPSNKGFLQYREYYTGWDSFASIFLGFFTTVTTRTMSVEACGQPTSINIVQEKPMIQIAEEEKPFLIQDRGNGSPSTKPKQDDSANDNKLRNETISPADTKPFNPLPGEFR